MATQTPLRRRTLSIEGLESRRLLTSTSSYYSYLAGLARHEYDHFVTEVQTIELQSAATPDQYLALRDDARAISEAATTTSLAPKAAYAKAYAASVQIDRSILEGSLSDQSWAEDKARLGQDLAGLNVPQTLIDRTIADERSVSASAGVTSYQYEAFISDLSRIKADASRVPSGYGHIPDPTLFFTQHLRGFFRGWAVQKTADEGKLAADLRSIPATANASPADTAAVGRDVQLLQNLGAPIPSADDHQIIDAYAGAFARGTPSAAQQSTLRSRIISLLGNTANPSRNAMVGRLTADTPAFFRGVGSSAANVHTIAFDVRTLVDDGEGASLDPFKVTTGTP